MTTYSIGQVAKLIGLSTYTLRFYDKEGLLPNVRKNSAGLRRFTEEDVRWLRLVECLKETGMPLKKIRQFIEFAQKGEETIPQRMQILKAQKESIKKQMQALKANAQKIDFKIKYYETALQVGEANIWVKNPQLAAERKRLFGN